MTLITFEDGKPLMKEDGKIGTEQACCCQCAACPENLYELCWSVTVTDFEGNSQTQTQEDFSIIGGEVFPYLEFVLPKIIGAVNIGFACEEGQGIFIQPGGVGLMADGCFGTPDPALFLIPCTSEENWWLGTTTGNAVVHNPIDSPDCPQPVATFSVTISEPPC